MAFPSLPAPARGTMMRNPVAGTAPPFSATVYSWRNHGVNSPPTTMSSADTLLIVPIDSQPVAALPVSVVPVPGFATVVRWMVYTPDQRSAHWPPHASATLLPLSRPNAKLVRPAGAVRATPTYGLASPSAEIQLLLLP